MREILAPETITTSDFLRLICDHRACFSAGAGACYVSDQVIMSLETDYHPHKLVMARAMFAAFNARAQTPTGAFQLGECNIHGFVVRGSGNYVLDDGKGPITRSIGDLDLKTFSTDPAYRIRRLDILLHFIRAACKEIGYETTFEVRHAYGSYVTRRAFEHFYPRMDVIVRSASDTPVELKMCLHLGGARPDIAPLEQPSFIKAENPYLRLAEKIRALHNTARIQWENNPGGLEAKKTRRALDILDTYQAYHMALHHAGSHDAVVAGLRAIWKKRFYSQFNRRTIFSIVQQNVGRQFLYADLKHFDFEHGMRDFVGALARDMEAKGMLVQHKTLDPEEVMRTTFAIARHMPLPLSRWLVRLRRPRQALRTFLRMHGFTRN